MKIIYKFSTDKKPTIFLDRDGVINFDKKGKYITSIKDVKIYKTAIKGLKKIKGYYLIIITNQSAINRGLLTIKKAIKINNFIVRKLKNNKITVHALYFCPHTPKENCNCRKPKTGLIEEASKDFNIDMNHSFIIGDKVSDIKLGKKIGIKTIFVLTGQGKIEFKKNKNLADFVVPNLININKIIYSLFLILFLFCSQINGEYTDNPLDKMFIKFSTISIVERFEYDIYWGFLNVGTASIEYVGIYQNEQGFKAYRIESRASSNQFIDKFFKVRDINISYLDTDMSKSYGYYKDIKEGKYEFKEYTIIDYKSKRFYGIHLKSNKIKEHSGIIENNTFDILSSLFVVMKSSDIDKKKSIEIITKNSKKIDIINHGVFKIKTNLGVFNAYKLEPTVGEDGIFIAKKGKSMYVYISKDDRLPLLLEAEVFIGNVKAVLRKYTIEKRTN
ncbi:MAG: HAD-IIIA family hydrolase [Elusimicrobiales bacterium]|nr:HAD-IIIA family hydrolase [Elusimicrobiales bacterium]